MNRTIIILITIQIIVSCSPTDREKFEIKQNANAEQNLILEDDFPETVLGIKLGEPFIHEEFLEKNRDVLFYDKIENAICYNFLSKSINSYPWIAKRTLLIPESIKAPSNTLEPKLVNILAFPKISELLSNNKGEKIVDFVKLSLCNPIYTNTSTIINPDGTKSIVRDKRIFEEDYDAVYSLLLKNYNFIEVIKNEKYRISVKLSVKDMDVYLTSRIDSVGSVDFEEARVWEVDIIYILNYEKRIEFFSNN